MSDAALARAIARRDAEANVCILAIMARCAIWRDRGAVSGEESPADPAEAGYRSTAAEIARRVKLDGRPAARASHPQPAPLPSLVDDEPLTEQDRRINAIAERFYARREGN
jgi:hypothetical protein